MMDVINQYIKVDGGAGELAPLAKQADAKRKSAMDTTTDVND